MNTEAEQGPAVSVHIMPIIAVESGLDGRPGVTGTHVQTTAQNVRVWPWRFAAPYFVWFPMPSRKQGDYWRLIG